MSIFFPSSISDDDEVPPLSSKFGDIYPMTGYEENSVVNTAVNGLHSDVNGEAENAALKAGVSSALCHAAKKAQSYMRISRQGFWMMYLMFVMSELLVNV